MNPTSFRFPQAIRSKKPHMAAAQFQSMTSHTFVWNPFNLGQHFEQSCQGAGCTGGTTGPTSNSLLLLSNNQNPSTYRGLGGFLEPTNLASIRGPYANAWLFEYGPTPGGNLNYVTLATAQRANVNYFYNLFSLQNSASLFCNFQFVPTTNALSFPGCTSLNLSSNTVTLPTIDLKTTAGLSSAIAYNYAPNSNTLSAATWQNTGAGTGTVTCSITDDQGNPACTITGTASFNWQNSNTGGYTAMPPNTPFTTQMRLKGSAGGELVGVEGAHLGQGFNLTTSWADYCVSYTTPASGSLSDFSNINLGGSYTIFVSNVVTRPGPGCGPPILTTNTQVLTPTAVNVAPTQTLSDNTNNIATDAFVHGNLANYVPTSLLAGSGPAVPTGPNSGTLLGDVACYIDTVGTIGDCAALSVVNLPPVNISGGARFSLRPFIARLELRFQHAIAD